MWKLIHLPHGKICQCLIEMFSQSTPIPILTTIVLNNKFKNINLDLMGSEKDRQICKIVQTAVGNILIN